MRRNDSTKWNDVFLWFAENPSDLSENKSQNDAFLKKLTLAMAEDILVTFTSRSGDSTPMLAAAIDGTDSILTLIKRGADVNRPNNYGRTALYFAAFYGNVNACDTLLDNKANINTADNEGCTPLMVASWKRKRNVCEFLIKKGADKTLTNHGGETASQLASFEWR